MSDWHPNQPRRINDTRNRCAINVPADELLRQVLAEGPFLVRKDADPKFLLNNCSAIGIFQSANPR